jgi:cytochrome P450
MAMARLDQTLAIPIKGYAWLPDLRRRSHGQPARLRVLGRPAVAISGPDAVRFFYTPGNLDRRGALPGPLVATLFGEVAAHVDGRAHDARRAMFGPLPIHEDGVESLAKMAGEAFDSAAERWRGGPPISLFDESAQAITDAVTRWADVPKEMRDRDTHAGDFLAVARFVAFAAHALERRPAHRGRLADDDYALAFTHELRRFYPFIPFLSGRATRDLLFQRVNIPDGALVLLDVYGQHHDPRVWPDPYEFRPERFLGRPVGPYELVPQGGGDPRTGDRCPGEKITVSLLGTLVQRLARLEYYLPPQDLTIDLSRIPARVRSGPMIVVPGEALGSPVDLR